MKLILGISVSILISSSLQAQAVIQGNDTLQIEQVKQQTQEDQKGEDKGIDKSSDTKDKVTPSEKNKTTKVKQVKGARPDMTKAKGARPQTIERPSGSRIPKGIGRPGGAGKPGGK